MQSESAATITYIRIGTSSVYNEEAEEFQTSAGVAELTKHDRHSYVSKTTTQNVAELEAVAENIHIVFIELLSFVGWTNTVLPPAIALFPPQEDSAGIVGVLPT